VPEKVTDFVIWYLNRMFETVAPPEDIAAVLVEPIQAKAVTSCHQGFLPQAEAGTG